jgi:hypothetical protein
MHVNEKNETCEIIPRMVKEGDKDDGRGDSSMIYVIY